MARWVRASISLAVLPIFLMLAGVVDAAVIPQPAVAAALPSVVPSGIESTAEDEHDGSSSTEVPAAGEETGCQEGSQNWVTPEPGQSEPSPSQKPRPTVPGAEHKDLEATQQEKASVNNQEAPLAVSASGPERPLDNPNYEGDQGTNIGKVTVTSSWTPEGTIETEIKRTITVTYRLNDIGLPRPTNTRVWHQYTVGADHTTTYTVSCQGGRCPSGDGMPSGVQTIEGKAGETYNTFWGVISLGLTNNLEAKFTIELTTTLTEEVCLDGGTVPAKSAAYASETGFSVPDDVELATVDSGYVSFDCPQEAVEVSNELTAPVNPVTKEPDIVLAQDPMQFDASWENTTDAPITLPISYEYSLPGEDNTTEANWTCTASVGDCPDFGDETALTSDGSGEPQLVFGSDPDDPNTFVTLEPGQELSYAITLKSTTKTCSDEGSYQVRTVAKRGRLDGEPEQTLVEVASPFIELGCADWVLAESFDCEGSDCESSIDDGWLNPIPEGEWPQGITTCLTRGESAVFGKCANSPGSPRDDFDPGNSASNIQIPDGYLQLTPDTGDMLGAVAYNRPIPAKNGLVVEFTQYQFGVDTSGADGIGFFLANGAFPLTKVGPGGGSLGYANDKGGEQGLPHGVLGVGFDVFGNYAATAHITAPQCDSALSTGGAIEDSVTLRGLGKELGGKWVDGYCAVGPTVSLESLGLAETGSGYTLRAQRQRDGLAGLNQDRYNQGYLRTALRASQRHTRVMVYPPAPGAQGPRVRVQLDFGDGFVTVLDREMEDPLPDTVRFGFLGSTGGSRDAHLLSNVRVGTVMTPPELELVKAAKQVPGAGNVGYNVGDTVDYNFQVHNNGLGSLFDVQVVDPFIEDLECTKAELPRHSHMDCEGTHTVTEEDRDNLHFLNTAEASAAAEAGGEVVVTVSDCADVAVNPTTPDDSKVIAPGQAVSFAIFDDGSEAGLVLPDDRSKFAAVELLNASGTPSGSEVIVGGQGTWKLDPAGEVVTFTPELGFIGDATPIGYRVVAEYEADGVQGQNSGELKVTVSNVPKRVCTPEQHRASGTHWDFGKNAALNFGTTGAGLPLAEEGLNTGSPSANTFTVADVRGDLQFVVDPTQGRIIDKSGEFMTKGGNGPDAGELIEIPKGIGASPVTVFPCVQGAGRYVVVTSSATAVGPGELTWRVINMSLNDGNGGLEPLPGGAESGVLKESGAGPAVVSVPSSEGNGYWVINPERGTNVINAFSFTAGIPGHVKTSEVGTGSGLSAGTEGYEDIRFRPNLSLLAAISSNGSNTQVRSMIFNATDGSAVLVPTDGTRAWTTSGRLGYSIEFSPNGQNLYFSSANASTGQVQRAELTAGGGLPRNTRLTTVGSADGGGAIRLGADGRLYRMAAAGTAVQYLQNPDSTGNTWGALGLSEGTSSGRALSNTLTDCSIDLGFAVQMLSATGEPIGGAQFALLSNDEGKSGTAVEGVSFRDTAEDGHFVISGLPAGTYWLQQTKAPESYTLLAQEIRVNVSQDGTIRIFTDPVSPQVSLSNDDDSYTIEIRGGKTMTLPFAGTPRNWLVLAGAVITVFSVFEAVRRYRAGSG